MKNNAPSPKEEDGNRKWQCSNYNTCLTKVSKKLWKRFTCDGCMFESAPPELCDGPLSVYREEYDIYRLPGEMSRSYMRY